MLSSVRPLVAKDCPHDEQSASPFQTLAAISSAFTASSAIIAPRVFAASVAILSAIAAASSFVRVRFIRSLHIDGSLLARERARFMRS
jgi:hypothetical protein